MKLIFVRILCFAALAVFFNEKVSAQPYHQLTIADFQGAPTTGTGVIAYTNCSITFKYGAHRESNYYVLDFNIGLILNTDKSWLDRRTVKSDAMLADILKHEQGHYTIAYMEQQELLRTVTKTVFYADYKYRAAQILNRIDAKYKQLNADYDSDTGHMLNRQQQQSWDAYFKKRLGYMPPV